MIKSIKLNIQTIADSLGQRTKALIYGSGLMVLSTIVSTLTKVGLIAILARIYSKDEFGIWVAITSATAVMATSDFGIGNALRNKLAELRVKGEQGDREAREYFLSVFYFFLIAATIISLFLLIFKDDIGYQQIFKTNNLALQQQGANILIGVQTIFLFGVPIGIGSSMFFAYQESFWVAVQTITTGILSLVVISILALTNANITVTAIVFFLIAFLINGLATLLFLYRRKWGLFDFNYKKMLFKVKQLLRLSISFAILQISGAFIYNATTLIVTANLSLSTGAELNLVQKLYTFVLTVYLSFYNPLWAGHSDAINRNDWNWCRNTLIKTILFTSVLYLAVTFVFVFYGNFFLQILAGKGYVSDSLLFLYMGIWALFYSLYSMGCAFLAATGKINLITVFTALFSLLYITAGRYISTTHGIAGVALLTALIFVLLTIVAYLQSFIYIHKHKSNHESN